MSHTTSIAVDPGPWETDAALVSAVRAKNSRAVEALFHRHSAHIHHILLHILGPEAEVPDLLHDVFVRAIEGIDELNQPEALRAWLSSTAVNMARTFIGRRRRFWAWPSKSPETLSPSPSASPDVSTALRTAYAILDRMPVDERIPFILRALDRMRLDEIAESMNTSVSTVKRRLRRADARFRRLAERHPVLHAWLEETT